jgi:PleD family two-component response regulator
MTTNPAEPMPGTASAEAELLDMLSVELCDSRRAVARMERQLTRLQLDLSQAREALHTSRQREARAWRIANRDAPTGLPSRRNFDPHSTQTLSFRKMRNGRCRSPTMQCSRRRPKAWAWRSRCR